MCIIIIIGSTGIDDNATLGVTDASISGRRTASTAKIFYDGQSVAPSNFSQGREVDLGHEARLFEIASVHLEEERGFSPDRILVVRGVCPVRRPDLDQAHTRTLDDFRNPKRPPDLDEFPPRDDHFASPGEPVENEKQRCGVVVARIRPRRAGQQS